MFCTRQRYATVLTHCAAIGSLWLCTHTAAAQVPPPPAAATRAAELAKFDDPKPWMAKSGPGGTAWDNQYRSFIQTDSNATSKGFPNHARAADQIYADARISKDNLLLHKGWVLFIRSASEAYRPPEATADLKRLYTDLVGLEFGDTVRAGPEPAPAPTTPTQGTTQPQRGVTPPQRTPPPPQGQSLQHPAAAAMAAANARPTPFEDDPRLTIERDVVYGRANFAVQQMDAYLVKSASPTPVLVEFHGGGWRNGTRNQFDAYPAGLVSKVIDAGISVILVDYRLTPDYIFPAQTDDAARAIQFIRSRAREWNIDPGRIIAMGGSAGAHLAAWVALHDDLAQPGSRDLVERQSSRLTAFIDFAGPMDLMRPDPGVMSTINVRGEDFSKAFTAFCGCTAQEYVADSAARKRMRTASPLFLVSKGDPPALIIHQGPEISGKDHPPIPAMINDPHSWQHGVLLANAMDAAGIAVVRHISPTAGRDPAKDIPLILGFLQAQFRRQGSPAKAAGNK